MATLIFLALIGLCASALGAPQPQESRNTIFIDELLPGEIFEQKFNSFDDAPVTRDTDASYRLPNTTVPVHYNVLWAVDLTPTVLSFSGFVEITLRATQPGVTEIVLHSKDLTLSSLTLKQGDVDVPFDYTLDTSDYSFLVLNLRGVNLAYNEIDPVLYTFNVSFAAPLRDDMYGLYKSWYRNNPTDTAVSWMASTQFQSTSSRAAFPCYDEPRYKATFDITVRRATTLRSWANTLLLTTANIVTGYTDDIYRTTPIMSTYLIAILVADYSSVETTVDGVVVHDVIARPAAIADGQAEYADITGRALTTNMSALTGIEFYSSFANMKMTQAAIPDFSAGAMENWGLLTYREAYLMYKEGETNSNYKQLIAYILSHEVTHMWYGNLVTCEWWDVTWLNEGFARFYQYFLTDTVEPEMGFETRFIVEQVHTSLLNDAANNAHALSNPGVGSPASVSGMFTTITYNKGAAVIRMTQHLLGRDINDQALRVYLSRNAYNYVYPEDLFSAMGEVGAAAGAFDAYGSDFDFIEYYKSWTEQPGHPVLNVRVDHATGDITITQRRFNINTGYSSVNTNWIIPISFSTGRNPDFEDTKPSHILKETTTVINRGYTGDDWIIFNRQQTGFYRVYYDDYTWDLITLALKSSNRTLIHEYNRAQIVNDVFQFARSGLMTYTRAFNILSFLADETDYAPWVAAVTGFNWIRNRYTGTTTLNELHALIISWSTNVMNTLGYEPPAGTTESFMRSYLRLQLAPTMCNVGVQACRTSAQNQLRALIDNNVVVPPDSRTWVYCNGLRLGTEADYQALWQKYLTSNVYTEKILLLGVLGCSPFQNSIRAFLSNIIEDNYIIRPQDYTTAFNSAVTGNAANAQIVFQYITENLEATRNAFGSLYTPLSYIASMLQTTAEVTAFRTWVNQNQAVLGDEVASVLSLADSAQANLDWAVSSQADLTLYLVGGGSREPQTTTTTTTTTEAPTIESLPALEQPITPELYGAASSVVLSSTLLIVGLISSLL